MFVVTHKQNDAVDVWQEEDYFSTWEEVNSFITDPYSPVIALVSVTYLQEV